jgi:hypothetical protein
MGSKLKALAYAFSVAVHLSSAFGLASGGFRILGAILKAEAEPGEETRHHIVVVIADEGAPLELEARVTLEDGRTLDMDEFALSGEGS